MTACDAIRRADALLPGVPVQRGRDPRWQAIIEVAEHIEKAPESMFQLPALRRP